MECYLLSEPKVRGYRKRMLNLWFQKSMFWVSEDMIPMTLLLGKTKISYQMKKRGE